MYGTSEITRSWDAICASRSLVELTSRQMASVRGSPKVSDWAVASVRQAVKYQFYTEVIIASPRSPFHKHSLRNMWFLMIRIVFDNQNSLCWLGPYLIIRTFLIIRHTTWYSWEKCIDGFRRILAATYIGWCRNQGERNYLPTLTLFLESRTRNSTQGRATIPLPRTKIFLGAIFARSWGKEQKSVGGENKMRLGGGNEMRVIGRKW